ncbi:MULTISPECIES: LysE family transporter [Erwiniaceae]|uniref:LysE family transporter n=1 Tax=Erwiniaceae TaxID=1903409 RepID=UPI00090056B9|nr:LysE family transporter [uncultured Pantoea sp.]
MRDGKRFRQGVLMHILNPRAILTWVSIISVTLTPGADAGVLPNIMGGCAAICVAVFCSLALLFSAPMMAALYQRVQRMPDAVLGIYFRLPAYACC